MSFCYIFQNGQIALNDDGLPPQKDACCTLADIFVNSGYVDKESKNGDIWAEIPPDAVLPEELTLHERRSCWNFAGAESFFRIGKAFHHMDWQRLHRFCGKCGCPTAFDASEGAMRCAACGELYYPVICPAVIVCVEKDGKILLGHGVNFPKGRYSVLAGFVEPGESLEDCVRREVFEESGLRLKNIRYFKSQPWPFPRSLMLGFTAEWESGEIVPQLSELSDVNWFAPSEIPDYYRGISISAMLIEDFVKRHKTTEDKSGATTDN